MNRHWESFAADLEWFLSARRRVDVGPLSSAGSWQASEGFRAMFPALTRLLEAAHTSRVRIDDANYVLFSWEGPEGISSWLAPPAESTVDAALFPAHRALLREFGGISERTNEPDGSWLLNTNESLTLREAQHDATFISDYGWAFEKAPGGIPIDTAAYYSMSREANGNNTLCHRVTGDVLLFAPDHAFNYVRPLEGCPDYTLYRINGADTFVGWVEAIAHQWMGAPSGAAQQRNEPE